MPSLFLFRRGLAVLLTRRKAALVAFWRTVWQAGLWPFFLFVFLVAGCVLAGVFSFFIVFAIGVIEASNTSLVEGTAPEEVAVSFVLLAVGMSFLVISGFVIYASLFPFLQRRWPRLRVPSENHCLALMGAATIGGTLLVAALVDVEDIGRIGAVTVGGAVFVSSLVLAWRAARAAPGAIRRVQDTGFASLSAHQRLALLARATNTPKTPSSLHP